MDSSTEPSDTEKHFTLAMLMIFSVVGVAGNGLVIYCFRQTHPKMTSTIFILTLAGIDLITCLITIPFTMAMEILRFSIPSDVLCKCYHFLLTSLIPLSAFVIVAIAVDRYFCICRPLLRLVTEYRARVMVFCLCILALVIGIISCLNYGTNFVSGNIYFSHFNDSSGLNESSYIPMEQNVTFHYEMLFNYLSSKELMSFPEGHEQCFKTNELFGPHYNKVYEKVYSACFATCGVTVIILYVVIYRFIFFRRRRRLKALAVPCVRINEMQHSEKIENTEGEACTNVDVTQTYYESDNEKHQSTQTNTSFLMYRNGNNETRTSLIRRKEEQNRASNIKTALMLSLVAFVFILAFLPAWMMKHRLIPFNIIVFYIFFIHNVANPFIYAFMNPEFQGKMKDILRHLKRKRYMLNRK